MDFKFRGVFYLLFAAALVLNVSPLAFLAPVLTALALAGTVRPDTWPDFTSLASPQVIEFLYGVVLAHLATRRRLPGKALGVLLLGGGFLALLLMPEPPAPWGFIEWGLPSAAMVAGAVALEDALGRRLPKWLLEAGDASYALYLSHIFLLPAMVCIVGSLRVTGAPALAAAVALGLAISFPAAILVHRCIEKPLMHLFKKRQAAERFDGLGANIAPVAMENRLSRLYDLAGKSDRPDIADRPLKASSRAPRQTPAPAPA